MHYQWPKIKRLEIKYTIFKSSAKKTPGPDRLSFRVLRKAYATVPKLFNYLYLILMANDYHPKCFKKATGIILKKSQATKLPYKNYTLSKAYRVISLLNCLIKVMEKIVARKLTVITEFKTLLHMHQIGGRRQKSAIDAVIILIQKMQANWRTRKRSSITSVLAVRDWRTRD
jgi:flagellin-specific chaperone FliS